MRKDVKTKILSVLLLITVVSVGLLGYYFGALGAYIGDVSEVWVQPPFHEASYLIGVYNSTHYYAQNSSTGNYDYQSTNASYVINSAFSQCSSGTNKIVLMDDVVIDTTLVIPNLASYSSFTFEGITRVNITSSGNIGKMLDYAGTSYIQGAGCPKIYIRNFKFGMFVQSDSDICVDLSYAIGSVENVGADNINTTNKYQGHGFVVDVATVNNPSTIYWQSCGVGGFRTGFEIELDHFTGVNLISSECGNSSSTSWDFSLWGHHMTLINPQIYKTSTQISRLFTFSRYGDSYVVINPYLEVSHADCIGFYVYSGTYSGAVVNVYNLELSSNWAGTLVPNSFREYVNMYFGDWTPTNIPSSSTYTIDTDGTNYWALTENSTFACYSTNASYVFDMTYDALTTGGSIFIKAGTYNFDSDISIEYDNIETWGEGINTHLNFSATSKISLVHTTDHLDFIGFYNLRAEGNDVATNFITAEDMPVSKRVRQLKVIGCRIYNFAGNALNIKNPELVTVEHNDFSDNDCDLRLYNDQYHHGNVWFQYNFAGHAHDGEKSVHIENLNASYVFSNFQSRGNHYYADQTGLPDVESVFLNASVGQIGGIHLTDDRTENCGLFNGTITSGKYGYSIIIKGCQIAPSQDSPVGIELPLRSRHAKVSDCSFTLGNGETGIHDLADSTSYYSTISDCTFIGESGYAGYINGTVSTYAHDNTFTSGSPSQLPIGVKSTLHRNGYYITYWGSNTGGWISEQNYTIMTCDVILSISGGTVSEIKVFDWYGNTFLSGVTTLTRELIPWHFRVWINFTSTPTLTICFTGS